MVEKERKHPQVMDGFGEPSGDICLLQKSEFESVFFLSLKLKKQLYEKRKFLSFLKSLSDKDPALIRDLIDKCIQNLKDIENHDELLKTIRSFVRNLLEPDNEDSLQLYFDLFQMMLKYSMEFFTLTDQHPLDKALKPRDKFRSLTNYLINFLFNFALNEGDERPGMDAYGYSYLYPYTDNLMDMKTLPVDMDGGNLKEIKQQFCKNIDVMLETGEKPMKFALEGSLEGIVAEKRIYELLEMVSVNVNSGLVRSLKGINLAQKLSLKQECGHQCMITGYEALSKSEKKDIFDITVMKGAASVLVNPYMKNPNLSEQQADLVAAFGYLGQFINDIEGINEDLLEKRFTPVTMSYLKHKSIDKYIMRLLYHCEHLKQKIPKRFPNPNRIQMLFDIIQIGIIETTAFSHQRNGIISKHCLTKIENEFGVKMDLCALVGKLVHQLLGGSMVSQGNEDLEERFTNLKKFKDLVIKFLCDIKCFL